MENECFGCGCTETTACTSNNVNCHWLTINEELGLGVCSNCPSEIDSFNKHQAEMNTLLQQTIFKNQEFIK